ncbi:MAG: helix-turn-helix domain-containing protein [Candidatus Bathyarchaeota archaeon]|nr:helix-turn-helix domain-containing protein [Candidatus Bathyarchaeota archaeon]
MVSNVMFVARARDAGVEGLTVEEIAKKTKTPKSTVYNVLSKLQAASARARAKHG